MSNSAFLALVGDLEHSAEQSCEHFIVFFLKFVLNNIGGEISNNYYPRSNGAPFAFVLKSTKSQCVQPLEYFRVFLAVK